MKHTKHPRILPLPGFRIPDYPDEALALDARPLAVVDVGGDYGRGEGEEEEEEEGEEGDQDQTSSSTTKPSLVTPAIGVASILYAWHPMALAAFMDLDAWSSVTWTLIPSSSSTTSSSTTSSSTTSTTSTTCTPRLEIGRIGPKITFGTLSPCGSTWSLMLTYDMATHDMATHPRGTWLPNPHESMQGEQDVTDPAAINALAQTWLHDCLARRVWAAGKAWKHGFWVEYAGLMDVWGDGLAMVPGWLYEGVDLGRCAWCRAISSSSISSCTTTTSSPPRCARCGTASYCSRTCQAADWPAHKFVCTMGLQDRGQMLQISAAKRGLLGYDEESMFAREGEGVQSVNCNFIRQGVAKRVMRRREGVDN